MANTDKLKFGYSLIPNTLPETDGYHAVVRHVKTVDQETFCSRAAARRPGLDASTVELVLSSVCSAAAEFLEEHQYRIALKDVAFELAIPGATDSVDGNIAGPAYVAVRASRTLRNAAAGLSPVYSEGDGVKTEIFSVEDCATRASNTIVGTNSFNIIGTNISASGDGECVKVSAANGTEATAYVDSEDGTGQYVTAHLSAALSAGKGKVVLKTHGWSTPEGELHQCVKSVTIIAGDEPPEPVVPAPTIDSAGTQGFEPGVIEAPGGVVEVSGSNLETETEIDLLVGEDGTPVEDMELWQSISATYDEDGGVLATNGVIEDSAPQSFGMVRVTTAGGSATYPVQYSVH